MKNLLFAIGVCLIICRPAYGGNVAGVSGGASAVRVGTVVVRGNSMNPLLKNGESVKIDYRYYITHEIHRGDIVVCHFSFRRDPLIKVVRAVPGDKFRLEKTEKGVRLSVNDSVVRNSAGLSYRFSGRRERMLSLYERDFHGVIPQNAYLLLGDIPEGSLDSSSVGLVSREAIIGYALRQ